MHRADFPICVGLKGAVGINGSRFLIVEDHRPWPQKNPSGQNSAMINIDPVLELTMISNNDIEINISAFTYNTFIANLCPFSHLSLMPDLGVVTNRTLIRNFSSRVNVKAHTSFTP